MLTMFKKLLLSSMLLAVAGYSQQENTIYGTLLQGGAFAGDFALTPAMSRGQSGHQAILIFTNAPAHVCATPDSNAYFQGSYDTVAWIQFGTNYGSDLLGSGITSYVIAGQGAYPYIRVHLVSFDNVNCRATIYYSGSITQSPVLSVMGAGHQGNPVYIAGSIGGAIAPIFLPSKTETFHIGGPSTSLLFATDIQHSSTPATNVIYIASVAVNGPVAGTIQLGYGDAHDTCGTFTPISPAFNIGPGVNNAIWGSGIGFVTKTLAGMALCQKLVGAGSSVDISLAIGSFTFY